MRTHANDTTLIQVLSGILAHIGDVVGQLLHTALGLAHLEGILVDVNRCEDVLTHHALVEHDSVLIVISLPGHVCHLEVTSQSQFTVLGRVALGEQVALLDTLAAVADGAQVDGCALVGLAEFGQTVLTDRLVETDELLVLGAVVADADNIGIDILNNTSTLGHDLRAAVIGQTLLNASAHNGSLAVNQRYSLAHHVGTHQRAVSIVVLQERDQSGSNRRNLLRRHVHQLDAVGRHNGEVGIQTCLDATIQEVTFLVDCGITLSNDVAFFGLGREVDDILVAQVNLRVAHRTIRCLDEAQLVDLSIHTQ